jgi:hypothetical protein
MNDKSRATFLKEGEELIGANLMDCHPEHAQKVILSMMQHQNINAYTIEKNGIKKLIYQMPWYEEGEFSGLVELSLVIPDQMPHFVRSSGLKK